MPTQLTMPRLSQDMETATVVEWLKHPGEKVERGEVILLVETDKALTDVEAPDTGVLAQIIAPLGTEAPVGAVLAIIAQEGEEVETTAIPASPPAPTTDAPVGSAPDISSSVALAAAAATQPPAGGRRPASPAAKRVARELGVDLAQVSGSGDGGLVTESDVRSYAEHASASAPAAAAGGVVDEGTEGDGVERIPLAGMRRRIADRMSLSRRIAADVTTVIDVDMSAVVKLRATSHLSYASYVAWAVARTLPEFPDLNATLVDDTILRHRSVNLGVAVALESGLIVPVVRDAQQKSGQEIEAEVDRLAEQARAGKVSPQDVSGATFTVTNSGTFGSLFFTPIINVPEVAILGVGRVADVPVVRDGQVVPGKVMYLCLSYDHRAVDGATAVTFLAAVKRRLQEAETELAG